MLRYTGKSPANYQVQRKQYWDKLHEEFRGKFSAVGYAGLGEGFNRATYMGLRIPAVKRILFRNGIRPQVVLEAGVGTGAYACLWWEMGVKKWVGVDISPGAIEDLAQRFPQSEFYVLDVTRSNDEPLARRRFELVAAIDVLYHIVEDGQFQAALMWLGAKVQSRGYLLVSDVFTDSPYGRRFTHVRRRPIHAYIEVLKSSGLELCDREPVFAILGDPVPTQKWHPVHWALYTVWRLLQKSIRLMPNHLKDIYGVLAVNLLWPIDALIRCTGCTRGVNLELSLFRKNNR